ELAERPHRSPGPPGVLQSADPDLRGAGELAADELGHPPLPAFAVLLQPVRQDQPGGVVQRLHQHTPPQPLALPRGARHLRPGGAAAGPLGPSALLVASSPPSHRLAGFRLPARVASLALGACLTAFLAGASGFLLPSRAGDGPEGSKMRKS